MGLVQVCKDEIAVLGLHVGAFLIVLHYRWVYNKPIHK
jgi:hypothetical protein